MLSKLKRGYLKIQSIYFILTIFIRLSLLFAIGKAVYEGNMIVLFISIIVLGLTFLPLLFRKRYNIRIPVEIELIIIAFIYMTLFLGELHGYYTRFWWWDITLHTGSAIVFGFIGFSILFFMYSKHEVEAKPLGLAVFAFSFAISIGTIWEIYEFFMDQIFGLSMQKNGLMDTMTDLIVDTLGALFSSMIAYIYLKTKKTLIFNGILKKIILKKEVRRKKKALKKKNKKKLLRK